MFIINYFKTPDDNQIRAHIKQALPPTTSTSLLRVFLETLPSFQGPELKTLDSQIKRCQSDENLNDLFNEVITMQAKREEEELIRREKQTPGYGQALSDIDKEKPYKETIASTQIQNLLSAPDINRKDEKATLSGIPMEELTVKDLPRRLLIINGEVIHNPEKDGTSLSPESIAAKCLPYVGRDPKRCLNLLKLTTQAIDVPLFIKISLKYGKPMQSLYSQDPHFQIAIDTSKGEIYSITHTCICPIMYTPEAANIRYVQATLQIDIHRDSLDLNTLKGDPREKITLFVSQAEKTPPKMQRHVE